MTLAIGSLFEGGIILGADTFVTSYSGAGWHESKIVGYQYDGGDVLFALSGRIHFAHAAIERCGEALRAFLAKPRTVYEIVREAQIHLEAEYQDCVIPRGRRAEDDYQLTLAIRSRSGELGLYSSEDGRLGRARIGYCCSGCAHEIGKLHVGLGYRDDNFSEMSALNNVAYALSRAGKRCRLR